MLQETYQRQLSVPEFKELCGLRAQVKAQQECVLKIMRRLGIVGATYSEVATRTVDRIDTLEAELRKAVER